MNFDQLVDLCHRTHEELGSRAIRAADAHLVVRNWLFGLYITEFEQNGTDRAAYGARVIESLADRLSPLKVKGTSATRLKLYRSFYRIFSIGPTLSDQLQKLLPNAPEKSPTVSDLSSKERSRALSSLPSGLMSHFVLGWSHYVELLTIDGAEERRFYEIEAAANQWSVRELQRQIASAVVSAPRFRLQGRGRSPSGPKIQAQRAGKPKSAIHNSKLANRLRTTRLSKMKKTPHSGLIVLDITNQFCCNARFNYPLLRPMRAGSIMQ